MNLTCLGDEFSSAILLELEQHGKIARGLKAAIDAPLWTGVKAAIDVGGALSEPQQLEPEGRLDLYAGRPLLLAWRGGPEPGAPVGNTRWQSGSASFTEAPRAGEVRLLWPVLAIPAITIVLLVLHLV